MLSLIIGQLHAPRQGREIDVHSTQQGFAPKVRSYLGYRNLESQESEGAGRKLVELLL